MTLTKDGSRVIDLKGRKGFRLVLVTRTRSSPQWLGCVSEDRQVCRRGCSLAVIALETGWVLVWKGEQWMVFCRKKVWSREKVVSVQMKGLSAYQL